MPLRAHLQSLLAATFIAFGYSSIGFAATPNRLAATISVNERASLTNSVHPKALLAADQGAADPALALTNMTMRFSLSDAQQASLTELLLEQQQPGSANYHKWLTPEQFGAQFGLSAADLSKVSAWLTAQGFAVTGVARGGLFVSFSGTAAQVQRAFATTIHNVTLNGEAHYAALTDPSIPAALSGVVTGITGLHNFKLTPRSKARLVAAPGGGDTVHPEFTSSVSGNHYIAPGDFYTIYDENALLTSSINGAGITIAVMGQTDISLSDVAAFRSASGLSSNLPTIKVYGTDPGTSAPDIDEAQLDVEWSGAAAPSASILYVNSPAVIDTSLTQAIDNSLAPIMTISYGLCETLYARSELNTLNSLFQQANAQGITVVGPGGDSGAADCDYGVTSATQGLAVDFPASSPFVTGVGGTMFNEGTGVYFSATNNANAGSAISYIPEAVWNETASQGQLAAGGGGASVLFTKPTWQKGTGVPSDGARDVPDISFDAAVAHDGFLICSQGSCVNGFRNAGGFLDVIGGTSIATPSFAGILALIEQKTASRIGNANPTLYALANSTYYTSIFHDVTAGNNAVPCTKGSTGCPNGGSIGYNATAGYDLASGWGSIDTFNLVNDWSLFTGSTSTAVVPASPTVTAGQSIAFTATVASATATFTSVPSGLVQLLIDGTANGTAATLNAAGTATITLSTAGVALGTHTITAVYLGGTSYATSKGTTTITVNPTTASIPSVTTISASTANVLYGATISLPVTVVSGSTSFKTTPSGSVQLQIDGAASGSPVQLVSGATTFQVSTNSLTTGTHAVTAVYSGDGVYLTSTGTTTINIGDFSVTGSTTSVTVKSGATAAGVTYTLASLYNFAGVVSLSATAQTLNALGGFSPATVTLSAGGSGTSVFTITATASAAHSTGLLSSNRPSKGAPWMLAEGGATLASLLLILLPGRRHRLTSRAGLFPILLLSAAAIGLAGCGSSGSTTSGGTSTGTPAGTYAVSITASSGLVSHITNLTVIVN